MAHVCAHAGSADVDCLNDADDANVHEIARASHWTMTAPGHVQPCRWHARHGRSTLSNGPIQLTAGRPSSPGVLTQNNAGADHRAVISENEGGPMSGCAAHMILLKRPLHGAPSPVGSAERHHGAPALDLGPGGQISATLATEHRRPRRDRDAPPKEYRGAQ